MVSVIKASDLLQILLGSPVLQGAVVLRHHETLPFYWKNDIDFLLKPDHFKNIQNLFKDFFLHHIDCLNYSFAERFNFKQIYIYCSDRILKLDFFLSPTYRYIDYANSSFIFENITYCRGLWVPLDLHSDLIVFYRQLLIGHGAYPRQYSSFKHYSYSDILLHSLSLFGDKISRASIINVSQAISSFRSTSPCHVVLSYPFSCSNFISWFYLKCIYRLPASLQ